MGVSSNQHSITFVVGPTASGKSQWALAQAQASGGAIVNADSVQIFKYLNIGTAKPTPEEQQQVPHYLYDLVDPKETFTAGDYRRVALRVIEQEIGKRPLYFVGGSGFYLQALEKGMYDVAPISDEVKSKVMAFVESGVVFEELKERDHESAHRIGEADTYRLSRALEVVLSEGRTLREIKEDFRRTHQTLGEIYRLKKVGVQCERDELRQRVEARTKNMLARGLLEEVRDLLARGYGETKAMQSIGYKECQECLRGRKSESELFQDIVTSTMQLAKRQMTWFKRDKEIEWIKIDQDV